MNELTTILTAVLASGAVSAYVGSRLAVDRHNKEHEAIAADLSLYRELTAAPTPSQGREATALAAVVRARLRQRLTTALVPSQFPGMVAAGLALAALLGLGMTTAVDRHAWLGIAYIVVVMLIGVVFVSVRVAEGRAHKAIGEFLDTNQAKSLTRFQTFLLAPGAPVAYGLLVTESQNSSGHP